jgi:hypothetical protein
MTLGDLKGPSAVSRSALFCADDRAPLAGEQVLNLGIAAACLAQKELAALKRRPIQMDLM